MSELISLVASAAETVEARAERRARRFARQTFMIGAAGFAVASALVFGSVSAYLALTPEVGAAMAALWVAGGWCVIALLALVIALASRPRQSAREEFPEKDAVLAALTHDLGATNPAAAAAIAAAIGAFMSMRRR